MSRDIDEGAAERLRARGLLLIVGAPGSGLTRTAFELACRDPLERVVIAPQPPGGLGRAVDELDVLARFEPRARLVVWLDRLDRFSPEDVTAARLRKLRHQMTGIRVIGTIPTTEYLWWDTDRPDLAAEFGDPLVLEREPSQSELQRSRAAYPDIDVSQGIGAAFTNLRALLVRLRAGYAGCPFEVDRADCGLARAVVAIAMAWAGTGTPRSLPVSALAQLVQRKLALASPPDPSHLAHALAWAAEPTRQGASLLTLIERNQDEPSIAMHPDVAEVRATEAPPDLAIYTAAIDEAFDNVDCDALGQVGFYAHATGNPKAANRAWVKIADLDDLATEWIERAADFSNGRGDVRAELPLRMRILELAKEGARGRDDEAVAQALHQLARVFSQLGEFEKAIELQGQVLKIQKRQDPRDDAAIARSLGRLGADWCSRGDPERGYTLLERALELQEKQRPQNPDDLASSLVNLSSALGALGKPHKARELSERALAIMESKYGQDHRELIEAITNLGNVSMYLGNPNEGRDHYLRALRIAEREYGRSHRTVAEVIGNLAAAWNELGQLAKARELQERALHIEVREYGPDHQQVAYTLNNLGGTLRALGEPARAIELLQRALEIKETAFGADHREISSTLNNLGAAWADLNEHGKATGLFERALGINERNFGVDHPANASTYVNLGNAWLALDQADKARTAYERALRIIHRNFDDRHPLIVPATSGLRVVAPEWVVLKDGRVAKPSDE